MHKGEYIESIYSEVYHKDGTPILISSQFLRRQGCGQVDISVLSSDGRINIFEIKAGQSISQSQIKRLIQSTLLIQRVTQLEVRSYVCFYETSEVFPIF